MSLSAVVDVGKLVEYTKQILILSPMYMIMAIIEWVKKSNFITRATLNGIPANISQTHDFLSLRNCLIAFSAS